MENLPEAFDKIDNDRYIMGVDPYDENGNGSYAIYDTIEQRVIESGSLDVLPTEPVKVKGGYEYRVKIIKEV